MPVAEAGLVRFFGDDDEIADCLLAHAAPGHSPGQVMLSLRHGDQHCIFSGDVLHSPMQVLFPDVNSRWCELPDVARATRHKLLADAAAATRRSFRRMRQGYMVGKLLGAARATASPSRTRRHHWSHSRLRAALARARLAHVRPIPLDRGDA
jgi:hypothetical protein